MKLGLYQTASPAGDLDAALAEVDAALAQAGAAGVDLLTLPEAFLPGYNAVSRAEPEDCRDALAALPELVKRRGIGLVIGAAEYTEAAVFNSAFAFGRTGALLARYRKLQLFGPREAEIYSPGDALRLFEFDGRRFGLMICYDVEFPEHTRALARAGAEALLVPTANMMPFVNVHEILVPARALESGLTVVYANYCGEEGDLTYTARSLIAGPDGRALAELGQDRGLAVATLPEPGSASFLASGQSQLAEYRPTTHIVGGTPL